MFSMYGKAGGVHKLSFGNKGPGDGMLVPNSGSLRKMNQSQLESQGPGRISLTPDAFDRLHAAGIRWTVIVPEPDFGNAVSQNVADISKYQRTPAY
jgi:hypothetical protein